MTESSGDTPSGGDTTGDYPQPEPIRYIHHRSTAETAAHAVDHAYGAATRWWGDVGEQLRAQAADHGLAPEGPLILELALASSYVLRLNVGGKAGCALRPQAETEDYAWPSRISDISCDVADLWRDVADQAQHPVARARFNDLLFERGDGSRYERARTAITGYLEAVRSRPQTDLDTTQFLVRAWQLARQVSDWGLLADVCAELLNRIGAELSGSQPLPGVVLPMLAAVPDKPHARQQSRAPESIPDPATVSQLLEKAFAIHTESFQTSQIAAMMRARTTNATEIEQINRREIASYQAQSAKHHGLARQARLEEAIRVARDRGFTDMVRDLTAELQAIPRKDLGLRESSWSVSLPRHQVELFLDGFVAGTDWRDGLHFFLQTACPTGDLDQLRRQVRDTAAQTIFLNLVSRVVLGKDGLRRYTGTSDRDRQAAREAEHARYLAEVQGQMLARGLLRMPARYGVPEESQIADFLSNHGSSDEGLALSLARGLRHYWNGDYEACVHVVTPKIEAAARALLRDLDEGIYRVQRDKDPGQYPGLHVLIQEIEKLGLEESWAFFLRWLLVAPFGMNIRNEVAHGFVADAGPVYTALILRAAALLITIVAPRPPSILIESAHGDDHPVDLAPLPQRDRDDLLRLLAAPVSDPIAGPWRNGVGGRFAKFTATGLRATATALNLFARRLDP